MRTPRSAGYTLVEVMMAIAVMTIGAAGIIAMQQAATRGNMEARQLTTATQVANRWTERLKRDALYWTAPATSASGANLVNTVYLNAVPDPGGAAPAWFTPVVVDANNSPGFDYWGRDTDEETETTYCTLVRLQWVVPGRAIRADVRVWWHKRGQGDDTMADADLYRTPLCGAGSEAAIVADTRLRAVSTSTVLRPTVPPEGT